jgi:hypothetical protein
MIEITEHFAVGLGAAIKVLTARQFEQGDPVTWIREIDDTKWLGILRYTFWIQGNPGDSVDLEVHLIAGPRSPSPWMVIIRYPHSDSLERWDFHPDGTPYRVKLK